MPTILLSTLHLHVKHPVSQVTRAPKTSQFLGSTLVFPVVYPFSKFWTTVKHITAFY